jgi:hypothetical protein
MNTVWDRLLRALGFAHVRIADGDERVGQDVLTEISFENERWSWKTLVQWRLSMIK